MKNKTILITGGTSGVGKEMVTHFTKLGYDIYALGRNSHVKVLIYQMRVKLLISLMKSII